MPGATERDLTQITGPCPCEGCRFRARCGAVGLACERFSIFVHGETEARWRLAPCAPSEARYAALFDHPQAATIASRARGGRPRKVRVVSSGGSISPL